MERFFELRFVVSSFLLCAIIISANIILLAQSKRQPPPDKTPQGEQKKNQRSDSVSGRKTDDPAKPAEVKPDIVDTDILKIDAAIVNVEAVVYSKKGGQIVTGMKKDNFQIFVDGKPVQITNFDTPEAPITISVVMEYSKWSEIFGRLGSQGLDSGKFEVVRPVAFFLQNFIKPPNDYASVIAFDIRPTPITDFTNDPNRINQTINLLVRNSPAFRENNLFDAMKFALVGGKGDSVVLDNSKEETSEYSGMVAVKAKRKAILLVASGIDTFSKINLDQIHKIVQNSGIPIYIISTGNIFYKLYENQLPPDDSISGFPGRLTFLQAQNNMNSFAKESGGAHFPVTFESELPTTLRSINALLRNQYSMAFDSADIVKDGKKHKIEVKVDVNGDGKTDEKEYVVQSRPFFNAPKDTETEKK